MIFLHKKHTIYRELLGLNENDLFEMNRDGQDCEITLIVLQFFAPFEIQNHFSVIRNSLSCFNLK